MDNPATLLTAIMFVTVLGMAIGNLLMTCADIAGGLRKPAPDRIHLSWMILLLLAMLNLFWETTVILDVADWAFLDFLYVITGPMILLFATGVIIAPAPPDADAANRHYLSISGRFFAMMAISQIWLVGIDLRFDSLGAVSLISVVLAALFVFLALSKNMKMHFIGNWIAWIGFIAPLPMTFLEI